MRLIHTTTYRLKEFAGYEIPQYAILSHTWGKDEDEVTYKNVAADFKRSSDRLGAIATSRKLGAIKIRGCCKIASHDGFEWLWVDTCCIDKSSSADLTEAINSMYAYYHRSARCYVYLADVSSDIDIRSAFRSSRWFTRGWTLQELLAPNHLIFYSKFWIQLGVKSSDITDESSAFIDLLSEITKIDARVLRRPESIHSISVAKRMSWAAGRKTKRVEDRAYSLLGIFNVNMPMVYGEEQGAFARLQEAIMRDSDDQSLFAWQSKSDPDFYRGLLAESPDDFADSGLFIQFWGGADSKPYSKTNRGLSIGLQLFPVPSEGDSVYLATLDCCDPTTKGNYRNIRPAIYLRRLGKTDRFVRIHANTLVRFPAGNSVQDLFIRQVVSIPTQKHIVLQYHPSQTPDHTLTKIMRTGPGPQSWTARSLKIESSVQFNLDYPENNNGMAAALEFTSKIDPSQKLVVNIGFQHESEIGWCITDDILDLRHIDCSILRCALVCMDERDEHTFGFGLGHLSQDGYRVVLGTHLQKDVDTKRKSEMGVRNSFAHLEIKRF